MRPGAFAVVAATVGDCGAQDAPLSLFGTAIGSQFTPSRDYLFVQNTTNTIDYTLRKVTNPEYLIQGVSVSQRSNVVVGINGRTASGDETACRRMLAESVEQLKQRYPKLAERVDDVNGRTLHTLSIKRNGCFTIVEVVKPALVCRVRRAFFCDVNAVQCVRDRGFGH